jgi:fucose 4-O-acetylase-like acetyltransferase
LRWLILLGLQAVAIVYLDMFYPSSLTLLGKEYELFGLPFNLDLVLLSGFFYILGNEIRHAASEKLFGNLWGLLITGSGLILLTLLFKQRIDFNTRVFESFPINTLEAILGILFTLAVSKQIDLRTKRLASALKYIGQASLFILIFHVPIQEYWAPKLYFVTDMQAFSILSAFVISVLVSLGIYRVFFEQNPIALFWFGRRSALPREQDEETESN